MLVYEYEDRSGYVTPVIFANLNELTSIHPLISGGLEVKRNLLNFTY